MTHTGSEPDERTTATIRRAEPLEDVATAVIEPHRHPMRKIRDRQRRPTENRHRPPGASWAIDQWPGDTHTESTDEGGEE